MDQSDWQNLSRKERRQLKRERKKLEKQKEQRKKTLLRWINFFSVLVIFGGSFFLFRYFKTKRYENAPRIEVNPAAHDFGNVLASDGKVETAFEIKNVGGATLTLSGMETSCGCTTARLKLNGEESPVFSMHNNPTDWSASLEPDKKAELKVVFDPNYHKDAFGSVTRTVSIFSNDTGIKEEKINIYATVQR